MKDKIIVRIEARAGGDGTSVQTFEEVHLEALAGAGRENVWRVMPRARVEHTQGHIGERMNVDRYLPSAIREGLLAKLRGSSKVASVLSERGMKKLQGLEANRREDVCAWVETLCENAENFKSQRGTAKRSQIASLLDAVAALRDSVLLDEFFVVPVSKMRRSAAKYEVQLREEPLQATRAIHTILTRMVVFHCDSCRERFPTFHPAFEPPESLGLDLLKSGRDGVAACSTAVASWNELPPPPDAPEPELLVATVHTGMC
ncbi:MAG: hypothetical protein GY747_03095, partial [Planctomycetes bacterium]|nr:hypothetical protein [Planctomycetota bacterium]